MESDLNVCLKLIVKNGQSLNGQKVVHLKVCCVWIIHSKITIEDIHNMKSIYIIDKVNFVEIHMKNGWVQTKGAIF